MSQPRVLHFNSYTVIPPRWGSASAALEDHWGIEYDVRWMSPRVSLGCFLYRLWYLSDEKQRQIVDELQEMLLLVGELDDEQFESHEQLVVVSRFFAGPVELHSWIEGLLAMIRISDDLQVRLMAADDMIFALYMRGILRANSLDVFEYVPRDIQRDQYRGFIEWMLGPPFPMPVVN